MTPFDFAAFKRAFTGKDVDAWVGFYAEDAEWIEYRPTAPPAHPDRMEGRDAIARFLTSIAAGPIDLSIADEVVGDERAAFSVTCTLPDGKIVFEHTIIEHRDGKIVRQVDVEAWDP